MPPSAEQRGTQTSPEGHVLVPGVHTLPVIEQEPVVAVAPRQRTLNW